MTTPRKPSYLSQYRPALAGHDSDSENDLSIRQRRAQRAQALSAAPRPRTAIPNRPAPPRSQRQPSGQRRTDRESAAPPPPAEEHEDDGEEDAGEGQQGTFAQIQAHGAMPKTVYIYSGCSHQETTFKSGRKGVFLKKGRCVDCLRARRTRPKQPRMTIERGERGELRYVKVVE